MAEAEQQAIIDWLADPAHHGGQPVDRISTHISHLFLAGASAYKLKRAVRLPYLDFSTPALRHDACRAELAVNRRTAPQLYRGLAAVTRTATGGMALQCDPPEDCAALDWLVVMHRFDQAELLDRLAAAGELTPALIRVLADSIAGFHAGAAVIPGDDAVAACRGILDRLAIDLRAPAGNPLDPAAIEAWLEAAGAALERLVPVLARRAAAGWRRDCHGDLHLGNIVRWNGAPLLFDAIEFNPALTRIDVLYDLAFLLMDLIHHGLPSAASQLFNRYADRSDQPDGLAPLALFQSMRAGVRAMVAASRARDADAAAAMAPVARRYLALAADLLRPPPPPRLVAVGGFSGSGKSTVAAALAPRLGALPGARLLRTDVVRKALWGQPPEARLPPEAYSPAMHARTYADFASRIRLALAAGCSVIADAVFQDADQRAAIAGLAAEAGVPFTGLWLACDPDRLRQRIAGRRDDASDATAAVLESQLDRGIGVMDWTVLDAGGPAERVAADAADRLGLNPPDPGR